MVADLRLARKTGIRDFGKSGGVVLTGLTVYLHRPTISEVLMKMNPTNINPSLLTVPVLRFSINNYAFPKQLWVIVEFLH